MAQQVAQLIRNQRYRNAAPNQFNFAWAQGYFFKSKFLAILILN